MTVTDSSDLNGIRVLGIDPALRCSGFAVVDSDRRTLVPIDGGVIRTSPKQALSECLRRVSGGMRELVRQHRPAVAAIEGGFFARNAKTAMVLGMVRGVIVATLTESEIPIYEYAPRRVKQAVCGHGNASKDQVAIMVAQILGVDLTTLARDATDAFALAVCHLQTAGNIQGLMLPPPL